MMKIVILDGYSVNPGDMSWDGLKNLCQVTVYDRTLSEEVVARACDCEMVLTNKVVLDKKQLDALPRLQYIGVLATGYNVIDIAETKRRGIIVTNIPAYSTDSVAQMAFAHILHITNRVGDYARHNRAGRWDRNPDFCYWDEPLTELAGKTLGIIGLGTIGKKVAQIAQAMGMSILALTSKSAADLPSGIQKATLDDLFAHSDILTLHCPLTETTREMINKDSLAKMKRGAILINTGRGPLVNEQDVAQALQTGQLTAYGADVLCQEPPVGHSPLLDLPNAFITPHIAWATVEARQRLIEIAVDNVRAFIQGHPVNQVNGIR